MHRHWPACEVRESHGWLLRDAGGVTKRANSVLPVGEPGDLDAAIVAAEAFYRERGRAVVFSIDDAAPAGLDGELAARGYGVVDPTLVMVRPLDGGWDPPGRPFALADAPSPGWLECWWNANTAARSATNGVVGGRRAGGRGGRAELDAARGILAGVLSTYASIGDGVPDAVGRLTVTGEWAGIYCMAVAADRRRLGLGRDVLAALLDHARASGARHAYLAVVEANAPARALYTAAGFTVAGRYHYRVAR